jgi:hypothetical protein
MIWEVLYWVLVVGACLVGFVGEWQASRRVGFVTRSSW